jgi:predicted adenylyl cyclase CyaB
MKTEIEIRSIVPDPANVIASAQTIGFELSHPIEQHDIMFDRPDGKMFRSGSKIRIRREGQVAELTYKGLFQGDFAASRRAELNVPIPAKEIEAMSQFLEALGFPVLFQVKKLRTQLTRGTTKITLDEWPIIGCLVEIEGEESEIRRVAEQIGPGQKFSGYRLSELFAQRIEQSGKSMATLKQEYQTRTGFELGNIEFLIS